VFTKAYKDNVVPFQGNLQDEMYLAVLQTFREFTP
jgi:hypothetical protein